MKLLIGPRFKWMYLRLFKYSLSINYIGKLIYPYYWKSPLKQLKRIRIGFLVFELTLTEERWR